MHINLSYKDENYICEYGTWEHDSCLDTHGEKCRDNNPDWKIYNRTCIYVYMFYV